MGSYYIDAQTKDNGVLDLDELEDPERPDKKRKNKALREAASAPAGLALKSNEEFWLKAKREAQKEAQHCRELLIGCALSRVKGCFYLGHFYDFRGRIYEENENWYMNNKSTRSGFAIANKDPVDGLITSQYYKTICSLNIQIDMDLPE